MRRLARPAKALEASVGHLVVLQSDIAKVVNTARAEGRPRPLQALDRCRDGVSARFEVGRCAVLQQPVDVLAPAGMTGGKAG